MIILVKKKKKKKKRRVIKNGNEGDNTFPKS